MCQTMMLIQEKLKKLNSNSHQFNQFKSLISACDSIKPKIYSEMKEEKPYNQVANAWIKNYLEEDHLTIQEIEKNYPFMAINEQI